MYNDTLLTRVFYEFTTVFFCHDHHAYHAELQWIALKRESAAVTCIQQHGICVAARSLAYLDYSSAVLSIFSGLVSDFARPK